MSDEFKPLNQTDKYTDDIQIITGLFSNGSGTLSTMYTASLSESDSKYYNTISDAQGLTGVEYFDVTFGSHYASGSNLSEGVNNTKNETRAIYRQFAGAFLDDPTARFTFQNISTTTGDYTGTEITDDNVYISTTKSSKMKDRIDPKFTISLSGSTYGATAGTGTGKGSEMSSSRHYFTAWTGSQIYSSVSGKKAPIVSGSAGTPHESGTLTTYGWFYENAGTWVFSLERLSGSGTFPINGPNTHISGARDTLQHAAFDPTDHFGFALATSNDGTYLNHKKMVHAIQRGGQMKVKTIQDLAQTTYYCRAFHNEFNDTSNPTKVNQNTEFRDFLEDFQENPVTFVTTIGLYNSNSDLIAVAKLNKPQKKDRNTEITFAVKVNG